MITNKKWVSMMEFIIMTIIVVILSFMLFHNTEVFKKWILRKFFPMRESTISYKVEKQEDCYKFLRNPKDYKGASIYVNTFSVTPKNLWEYMYCGNDKDFQYKINFFSYKKYWRDMSINVFTDAQFIDDLCYTFYHKMVPLYMILEIDCSKQYINALNKKHLTKDDDINDSIAKRKEILEKTIKNKDDLIIINQINDTFGKKYNYE